MSSRLAMGFDTSFSLIFLTKPEPTFDASILIRHVESRDKILLFLGFKNNLFYINLFYDLIKNTK